MDPFQAALDAQFNAPGSSAAVYLPAGGDPVAVRLIVSRPDDRARFGDAVIVQATHEISFRRSEVPSPAPGAAFAIVDGAYRLPDGSSTDTLAIAGEPQIDVEGLTWTCGANPA